MMPDAFSPSLAAAVLRATSPADLRTRFGDVVDRAVLEQIVQLSPELLARAQERLDRKRRSNATYHARRSA